MSVNDKQEKYDSYIIPPNFVDSGSCFGGMFKVRNMIEAGIMVLLISAPILHVPLEITYKIIVLCLTALPAGIFAIIGVNGESLTSFVIQFFRFLKNRRIVCRLEIKELDSLGYTGMPENDFEEEFQEEKPKKKEKQKKKQKKGKKNIRQKESNPENTGNYLPIEKISNGVIYTRDKRFIKILEVEPINFLLRSAREQRSIIYSFVSYLKVSPVKIQFKAVSKKADVNRHLAGVQQDMQMEKDAKCRMLQEDYISLIQQIGSKEAVTRRFFIVFEYEQFLSGRKVDENEAVSELLTAERTAKTYLQQCGNEVITHENENNFLAELFYMLLNREKSAVMPLSKRMEDIAGQYYLAGMKEKLDAVSIAEIVSPEAIDFRHYQYIMIDGVYYSFLCIPSGGYKSQVNAGWTSLLVNAGEGIDLDIFVEKQPKDKIQQKLGQQIRINRSKIKETSDTNSDFDDLDDAIRSGYFLKNGISNNQDFYFFNVLITITASSKEELDWRIRELKKLMIAQDLFVSTCNFRQEQAFLSTLPVISLHKSLYNKSKRNALTLGIASLYPFSSFELSDDNGILLGVNKHNNSLVLVDIFNSLMYKNANIAILGTSGAGKTFLMQLMALRMRRKNIQTFIVAPLKGHEFRRACQKIGGSYIQLSPASSICINIMEIRKRDKSTDEYLDGLEIEHSELAAKIQRLHIFFSLLIPDMNYEEKQLLDESLIETYNQKGITHKNESLINPQNPDSYKEMPILEDLFNILVEKPETKRMANILNRLVHGSASTFNQQTNVSLENKYIVLDISELTGDLLTIGMFLAVDFVWDKAKENRTEKKALFIDEVWQLIGAASNKLAAEFVLEIAKIIRGYGGSAIFATQDLNDFFALEDGKYGKGIINNCKTKIILNLEDEEAQRVQNMLNLSETEVMNITHFQRGNGLISTNNNNVTVEFKASQLEKELITTDRRELEEILARKQAK